MIKFFRKIRQRLLTENKLSKYLLYAIGEIVLVVIGILIALQINNWNENRKKDATVILYLNNLIENLTGDIEILEEEGNLDAFRFHSLQYVMKHAEVTMYNSSMDGFDVPNYIPKSYIWNDSIPTQYDKGFIKKAFLWSTRKTHMNLNTGAVDEMKNNGIYSEIPDVNLKKDIRFYYMQWNRQIGPDQQRKFDEIIERWHSSLGEEGLLNVSVANLEEPLQVLRNNDKRLYLLKRVTAESGWFAKSNSRTIDQAKKLIEAIESVLEDDIKL